MSAVAGHGDSLLQVRNLWKRFPIKRGLVFERTVDYVDAVADVSFDLHRGRTLGLVGESGSGKSTTGYCILQAIRPTSGSIVFDDVELTDLGARSCGRCVGGCSWSSRIRIPRSTRE